MWRYGISAFVKCRNIVFTIFHNLEIQYFRCYLEMFRNTIFPTIKSNEIQYFVISNIQKYTFSPSEKRFYLRVIDNTMLFRPFDIYISVQLGLSAELIAVSRVFKALSV